MSCLVITGLSFAMDVLEESQPQPLKLSLISKINDGKFISDHQMILSGSGNKFTGLVSYNIETKKAEKVRALANEALSIAVLSSGPHRRVTFWGYKECGEICLETKEARLVDCYMASNRSVAYGRSGRLFLYNTGDPITTAKNETYINDGTVLFLFNRSKRRKVDFFNPMENIECHRLECKRDPLRAGTIASRPMIDDEIAYTSHMDGVSIVDIKDKHVEEKSYIPVDSSFGYVSGPLRYSDYGSYLAIGVGEATDHSFLIYDFEKKELIETRRNVLDAVFYPNVLDGVFYPHGSIITLLQGDFKVIFFNFKTQEIIASINDFSHSITEKKDCNLSIELSPDGKNIVLFVKAKEGISNAFVIPVPVVVYAYNKANQEKR